MKRNVVWMVSVVVAFFLLSAPAFSAEKVTLKLNWVPGGDHCFYFVAKDKGFYQEEGLDVSIERGQGSGDTVKRVELGTVDVGLADTGTLAVARSKGAKVKVIAMIYTNSPNGIKTYEGSGITKPKDLEGHKVGVPAGDAQRVLWPALAKANNIDVDKVTLVNIKPSAKPQSLTAKQVDAVFDWIVGNQGYWEAGLDMDHLVIIPWSKWGVNPYGNALMASDKMIAEKPEMLKKFLKATMKAWAWCVEHPDEAAAIFVKDNPEVPVLAAKTRFVDDITNLVDIKAAREHKLGWVDTKRMQETVDYINKYFEVEKPVTAEEMFTTAFLPDYKMPSTDKLPTVQELYKQWKAEQKK